MFVYGSETERGVLLGHAPYIVIDLEATGLSPATDRVVEVALVPVEHASTIDEWATLIDPGCDPGPTYLHHISPGMLTGAPTFPVSLPDRIIDHPRRDRPMKPYGKFLRGPGKERASLGRRDIAAVSGQPPQDHPCVAGSNPASELSPVPRSRLCR
jgi:hypothetical protein